MPVDDHTSQWSFQSMIMQMNELINQSKSINQSMFMNLHGHEANMLTPQATSRLQVIITPDNHHGSISNACHTFSEVASSSKKNPNKINLKINQIKNKLKNKTKIKLN